MNKSIRRLIVAVSLVTAIFIGLIYVNYISFFAMPKDKSTSEVQRPPGAISSLRVVVEEEYPPYTFRDKKGLSGGISVDYWRLWEKKTGIPVEITAVEWSKAQQGLLSGRYDVIDIMAKSDERMKIFSFSPAYATVDVVIAYKKTPHRSITCPRLNI